ncbi:MAG: peroxidase [Saprospiraceae bacterium]|nr:peroxidase [Saprospiraceae bacterium]
MKSFYQGTQLRQRKWIVVALLLANIHAFSQGNRSVDGWLNNPDEVWGATFTNVVYRSPVTYGDGLSSPTGKDRPNPRFISSTLFSQEGLVSDPNGLNALVWVWGQFIDHDITLSPDHPQEVFNVPIPAFDPYFDPQGTGTAVIPMLRSDYDRTTGVLPGNPRRHYNATTAFIDGSTVYGPDLERADYLRSFGDGKLKTSKGNLLPYNTVDGEFESEVDPLAPEMAMPYPWVKKYYVAGDVRANENPLLTSIHTLFVREHNRYCDELKIQNPALNDEQLYQKARKWVGGLIEAVVYEEWLPLLGINLPAYSGYSREINPSIMNEFSAAAYRYGHTTITPALIRLDPEGLPHQAGDIALRDAFFNPAALTVDLGIEPYLMGATSNSQQNLDCKVIDELRNFLFGQPGSGGLDLVALNINRGRDRGLMDYNRLRTYFSLPLLESFGQISSDPVMQAGLEEVFGDVNKIDAWVGMLAEDHVDNSMFGPTAHSIILDQFASLRNGDRFYYETASEIDNTERN